MNQHANATLTPKQRQEIRRLHHEEKMSIRKLAEQFHVYPSTIQKWVKRTSPYDQSCAPKTGDRVVTEAYREAVIAYRKTHPNRGPIRIAQALKDQFSYAHRGTVYRILKEEALCGKRPKKKRISKPIPVGRHRVQMDIQQLPSVEGGKGFEYKISIIHMKTRMKYSEIHPDSRSQTVASVFETALLKLPPFS